MKMSIDLLMDIEFDPLEDPEFFRDNLDKILLRYIQKLINNSTHLEIGLPESNKNVVIDPHRFDIFAIAVRRK